MSSIEEIETASFEQLTAIDEIGETIANSIIAYFGKDSNRLLVCKLKEAGLQFESEKNNTVASNKLEGLSFVISGTFSNHSRDELKSLIEQNGGKNVGSISSKTNYVLAGENMGPAKLDKAKKLGIKIISEDEFIAMITL